MALRRHSSPKHAFTLIELLVVTSILVILLMIMLPALARIRLTAMRKTCMQNLRSIGQGCMVYARDITMHRGAGGSKAGLPSTGQDLNWHMINSGNPECMWLLVRFRFVAREKFYCPEAGLRTGTREPARGDDHFTYDTDTKVGTLSYSYLTMTNDVNDETRDWGDQTYMGSPDLDSRIVILADKNPRYVFNSTIASGPAANSLNHDGEGQNIAHLDGSVEWATDHVSNKQYQKNGVTRVNDNWFATNLSRWDSIYEPFDGNNNGLRAKLNDSFLAP